MVLYYQNRATPRQDNPRLRMENRPVPRNPLLFSAEVPCYTEEDYDGKSFDDYPQRAGWGPRPAKQWHILFRNPPSAFLAFLQTWRFFGLIATVFRLEDGSKPRLRDLIRQLKDPTRYVVDMCQFARIAESFAKFASRGDGSFLFGILTRTLWDSFRIESMFVPTPGVCDCLVPESMMLSLEQYRRICPVTPDPLPSIIIDSISLVNSFCVALMLSGKEKGPQPCAASVSNASFAIKNMEKRGWCPRRMLELTKSVNFPTLAFVSNFDPPHKTKHELCDFDRCTFTAVDLKHYETQHADGCSGCSLVVARDEKVNGILKSGALPLVKTIDQDNHQKTINLKDSSCGASYVAISHVWSDGLGNLKENAIPWCQLLNLSSMVRSLGGHSCELFWLDTICCPPDGKDREAQDLAIGRMRETYEQADKVLVLDSFLLSQSVKSLSDAEVMVRIICCGWNSRLWTLQEGALSKSLYFQFADGSYDLNAGLERLKQESNIVIQTTLQQSIEQHFAQIREFRQSSMSETAKFVAVTKALRFRSTSVSSDEPICIATLLGLDTLPIVKKGLGKSEKDAFEERMLHLWTMIKAIPAIIIFTRCERLKVDGYRWAPRSFLRKSRQEFERFGDNYILDYNEMGHVGQLEPRGFSVRFPGFTLTYSWKHPLQEYFCMRDQHHNWYRVKLDVEDSDRAAPYYLPLCRHSKSCLKIDPFLLPDKTVPRLMLIVHHAGIMQDFGYTRGILVARTTQEENKYFGRAICGADIYKITSKDLENHLVRERLVDEASGKKWKVNLFNGCLMGVIADLSTEDINWVVD